MRLLITGIEGFVGGHLAQYALTRDAEVWGTLWKAVPLYSDAGTFPLLSPFLDRIVIEICDLKDYEKTHDFFKRCNPDWIIHLAAQSSVKLSISEPVDTFINNALGGHHVLEASRNLGKKPKVLIISTAEVYGHVKSDDIPIKEDQPMNPLSPYAVSKVALEHISKLYYNIYGLDVRLLRPFNHTGPGQAASFVCSDFARQIALLERAGNNSVINVGNTSAVRDFTDVRDMVRAYWFAMEKVAPGETLNVSTGTGYSILEILNTLIKSSPKSIHIEVDDKKLRPVDIPVFIGDSCRFQSLTGWKPEISMEKTLADLLDYWRNEIQKKERYS